jgi:hypothetical protein
MKDRERDLTGKLAGLALTIGQDHYLDLTENQKAALAFGMADKEVMDKFEATFEKMIRGGLEDRGVEATKDFMKKTMEEVSHQYYLGLLAGAKEAKALLV